MNALLTRVTHAMVDPVDPAPVSRWATRWTWILAATDGMTLAWMLSVGDWLDRQHTLLSVASWGGHHRLVAVLAGGALLALALMAPVTRGFSRGSSSQIAVVAVSCFVSLLAVCGVLALLLPLLAVGVGVALLGGLMG